ncbi:MAG: preprotein translocase subunit SecG [Aestuariivita sp.]|nr:preprotein translocase subunit SecG [Aestuariivita sp.]
MENVILILHLLLALSLIGVVLLQRSEGGGLGMGSGGGVISGRSAATALGKLTWLLAIAFIITSMTLTIMAARNTSGSSVLDRLGTSSPAQRENDGNNLIPDLSTEENLLPPVIDDDTPIVPEAN